MHKKPFANASDQSDIDLTPMLDVVFILLIFFIVTASFVKEQVLDVSLPESITEDKSTVQQPIVVKVDASNRIWLEERQVDARALRANFERLHAEDPKAPVVVRADLKSNAATYVAVADAARQASIVQVQLLPVSESI
ncbi:ExbD/TolR family protein [Simiduia agarivorans]|uniref:Biopolymer transport ExbD2 protein n=1 Tax=Simiduia agarivorans (strain DSM 21679 / JCM 13881 / BCRC 17597 / SA1) TaxID=1117647 RepID=K4KNC9_SIMAS|nr:biopolymer transporter ExbD [Simiduia agarivorans]AFV00552.1 biopolymer transport ExbD2 protein [Simiduia agarivorans SA1 = DSM 21679]